MEIINLGGRTVNTYLLQLPIGWMLVDTGYEQQYDRFLKKLAAHGLSLSDIQFVFLTHAHDDHAGFLNALLEVTDAPVFLHPLAVQGLRKGQNSFSGGCTTRLAWFFCKLMALFGKGQHKFPKIQEQFESRFIYTDTEEYKKLENELQISTFDTPGHTSDSISFLADGRLFCGDAAMNNLPSLHRITIWAENKEAFCSSWQKILQLQPETICPGHGKPFPAKDLLKNYSKAEQMKCIKLLSQ